MTNMGWHDDDGYEVEDADVKRKVITDLVDGIPAVDAAPVKCGQWTDRHVYYALDCAIDEVQTAKCSVCGLYHTTPYLYSFTDFKFCPNCGAKIMEVEYGNRNHS